MPPLKKSFFITAADRHKLDIFLQLVKMYTWNLNVINLLFYELKNYILNSNVINDPDDRTIEMGGDLMADRNFLDFNQ